MTHQVRLPLRSALQSSPVRVERIPNGMNWALQIIAGRCSESSACTTANLDGTDPDGKPTKPEAFLSPQIYRHAFALLLDFVCLDLKDSSCLMLCGRSKCSLFTESDKFSPQRTEPEIASVYKPPTCPLWQTGCVFSMNIFTPICFRESVFVFNLLR